MNELLSDKFIKEHFTQPNRSNSHHAANSIGFDIEDNGCKDLLVTIGDSWTWGDELDNRVLEYYPHFLAQNLNADLLNLGCPGIGNHYISLLYRELVSAVNFYKSRYSKIYCVIVLTEIGREFNSDFDSTRDYASWLRSHIKSPGDYNDFLLAIDQPAVESIAKNISNNLEIYVGFNFIDNVYQEVFKNIQLGQTWIEICAGQSIINKNCYCVSPWLIEKLETVFSMEWSLDRSVFREWQMLLIENSQDRLDILSDARYYKPRYHPNTVGHQLWSQYILNQIKNAARKQ